MYNLKKFIKNHPIPIFTAYIIFSLSFFILSMYKFNDAIKISEEEREILFENNYALEKGGTAVKYYNDLPQSEYSLTVELNNKTDFYGTYALLPGDITEEIPYFVTANWIRSFKPIIFQKNIFFEHTTSTDSDGDSTDHYTEYLHPFQQKKGGVTFVMITTSPLAKFSVILTRYKVSFKKFREKNWAIAPYMIMTIISFGFLTMAIVLWFHLFKTDKE